MFDSCNDPALNYLKSFGYLIVELPKAHIKPLQICELWGKELKLLGDLPLMLEPGNIPLPPISENNPAPDITGQVTSNLRFGAGIYFLGKILQAMGGSTIGLDSAYKDAKTIAFEFCDVLEDKIAVAQLDQYLSDADINPYSTYGRKVTDANALAVITNALKSNTIAVQARNASGEVLGISTPAIKAVVGAKIQVSYKASVTHKLIYQGLTPLVFGFQARQVFYDRGRYTAIKPIPPSITMKGFRSVPNDGTVLLTTDGPFVRLHED